MSGVEAAQSVLHRYGSPSQLMQALNIRLFYRDETDREGKRNRYPGYYRRMDVAAASTLS